MQKKLIALAIAGLSSAAFAQTNVTIYGVADGTFDYINVSGNSNVAPAVGNPNNTRVTSNGSHLGFKGTENLGNGMKAIFQFESEVNFDSGAALGLNRDSFVGLNGSFGQVTLGTQTGPTKALGDRLDVNSGDTIMSNSAVLGKLGGAYATVGPKGTQFASGSTFDTRFNNSIQYVSPSFSGLQATAMYRANENKSEATFGKINSSAYDLGLTYENGPVFVGATYARISEKNDNFSLPALVPVFLGEDTTAKEFRIGGMYDFGMATVRALYARTKGDGNGTFGSDAKQNVWGIGGTYNVSPNGKLVGQYYKAADLSGSNFGRPTDNTGAKFYTIGYEHSLSKRTMLKAGYAYLKNDSATGTDGFGGYDFGYNSVGATGDNVKLSGFQFGMRHAF
ncbi:MAG: porin [Pseudomonadota bacterium]